MKYEIVEKGANGMDVGDTIEIKGELPGYLVGKVRAVGGPRMAVTNPAKKPVRQVKKG